MIFEFIGSQLASYVTKKAFDRALDAFSFVLTNDKALNFAREELRDKYQQALAPASYEHVVSHLRLDRDDFTEFYRKRDGQTSLAGHLYERLLERSEGWVYNRPDDKAFQSLINDFLDAYQRYFSTNDPLISILKTGESTKEILSLVSDIRAALAQQTAKAPQQPSLSAPSLAKEVRSFLTILNVPFDIVADDADGIDVMVLDPSSVFANRFLLCVRTAVTTLEAIDDVAALTKVHRGVSNTLLVAVTPLTYEIAQAAERRRISVQTYSEFQEAFYKLSPLERYVLGSLASGVLAESLNVHEVYVSPDAFAVEPGDIMEHQYLDVRGPAIDLIDSFINNQSANILFILGGYGSGKSALCARLMHLLQTAAVTPVYFSLRQVRNADDLTKIVTKADQLSRALGDQKRRPLVILDGLDELPNAMNGEEKKQNMLRLLEAATRTDKLIITARTSYFRGIEDFWHLFSRPQDTSAWNSMAKFIPEGGRRPSVGAIILREFNSDQIELYLSEYARIRGLNERFADEFLKQIGSNDFGFNYRMLARSPLYLFLLVNSRPWESADVGCLADVYALFVKYWLERDVEKGRSRWSLTTTDRFNFTASIARKLFEERRHALTFEEFDDHVKQFIGSGVRQADYVSLALDLQTTGLFNCIGNRLQFFSTGFLDYFVMHGFDEGVLPKKGLDRLPTFDQVCMWAGFAETHRRGFNCDMDKYMASVGIKNTRQLARPIDLDPTRIIYHLPPGQWKWPFLNDLDRKENEHVSTDALRGVVHAVLQRVEADHTAEVRLRIANRRGLHARAAAKVVSAYEKWMNDFIGREAPDVTTRREGDNQEVSLGSIMGLMMIGAGTGTIVIINYDKCSRGEIEVLLEDMGCKPSNETGVWAAYFHEIEMGGLPLADLMIENVQLGGGQ